MWRVTSAALAIFGTPIDALACPFCDGTNGRNLVKKELFTENFWYFGLATFLPFAVCVAIVSWLLMNPQSVGKNVEEIT